MGKRIGYLRWGIAILLGHRGIAGLSRLLQSDGLLVPPERARTGDLIL